MRRAVVIVAAAVALVATSNAFAAPPIARPNPAVVNFQVDYVSELHAADGSVASLPGLDPSVIAQAVADQQFLAYLRRDDLGGFVPAPLGQRAASSGGRNVVGAGAGRSELPQLEEAASGTVRSFAFVGPAVSRPPDDGRRPVRGVGVPTPVPAPTNSNEVPPPNQGFGGRPAPAPAPPPAGTTTTTRPPGTTTTRTPPTTTTTTPTPTTTPSPPPTTTPTTPGGGGGGSAPSCGTAGLRITSDLAGCRIEALNMAPGGATVEHVTITNESDGAFDLTLKATGTQNRLWNDLQLGVWEQGTAAPSPLPPLLFWTTQENPIATLQQGRSITLVIELALPASAGNADQGLAATIDFHWHAQA